MFSGHYNRTGSYCIVLSIWEVIMDRLTRKPNKSEMVVMDKWIEVSNGIADIMPNEDCEIWIARCDCFGNGWIQKVDYYANEEYIGWDGTCAYQIVSENKPKPYVKKYADGTKIVCEEII